MKRTLIIALLTILSATSALRAQDTIDTAYYRYDHHFDYGTPYNIFYTHPAMEIIKNVCPNGTGFKSKLYWKVTAGLGFLYESMYDLENDINGMTWSAPLCRNNDYIRDCLFDTDIHMYYKLSAGSQYVYGIAFTIEEFLNLTEGDFITAVLCTRSADHTHFVDLDSITIKGGETGKRRWMEIPMLRADIMGVDLDTLAASDPYDNCIDTVSYLQVLEFYFDRPYRIDDDFLCWKLRVSYVNGSTFCLPFLEHPLDAIPFVHLEDGEIAWSSSPACWDVLFPILSPLPEWEVPTITQVVPDAQKPNTPPDPDDPQNPDDPDDPDNPGGDEGIGEADGVPVFDIRPNPTGGMTTITSAEPISELTVRDMAGRTVLRKAACGATATFDTSTLRKGVYLVKVTTVRGTTTKKLVVE